MNKTKGTSITSVISASSVGTMIEWYDFYIFGSLATIISTKFFPQDNPTAAFLSTLATFAAGFVVRPFGALFFGRLGDLIGRKYTFMVTLLLMGGATFLIGCIPSYETIGFMAPVLILLLRLLQGLALGGEYGGAATYVAEHSPEGKRGFMTAWIQTTATVGLFVSLLVIMGTRAALSAEDFDAWGWRVPFWVSILMVLVSYLIRKNMEESPVFAKAKAAGKTSTNPLKESFGKKLNFKFVLLALFGAVMGQGVIWYTGQFYAMSFIEKTMNVDKEQVDSLMFIALMLGTPFFLVFGWLSDKIGRKWIMMAGMLIAIVSYRPIYENMYQTTNLANKVELSSSNSMVNNVNTVTTVYADSTIQQEIQKTNPANGAITTTIKPVSIAAISKSSYYWYLYKCYL
jgi:MFS family permease